MTKRRFKSARGLVPHLAFLCIAWFLSVLATLSASSIFQEPQHKSYAVDIFSAADQTWLLICSDQKCSVLRRGIGASNWVELAALPLGAERIYFSDAVHGWCLVTGATSGRLTTDLWGTGNGGKDWELLSHPSEFQHFGTGVGDMAFLDSKNGWVLGRGAIGRGAVLETNDAGHNLYEVTSPPELQRAVNRIFASSGGDVWFVGNRMIVHRSQTGQSWETREVPEALSDYPLATRFESIKILEGGLGWVVGGESDPVILSSKDAGRSWEIKLRVAGTGTFNDIAFGSKTFGCAVGSEALVFCTNDGGNIWRRVFLDQANSSLKRVVMLPSGEGWIVSVSGELYEMKGFSGSWNRVVPFQ